MSEPPQREDPFENFDQQQRSYELLEQHRHSLRDELRELRQQHPELDMVGLIVDTGVQDLAVVRQVFGQHPPAGLVALVPRPIADAVLAEFSSNHRGLLPGPVGTLGEAVLGMVVLTRGGVRFAAIGVDG